MRIDFAKIVMIRRYGGMYVDMDFLCRENFHQDLNKPVVLSGSHHTSEDVQNGLIAGVADHEFFDRHIDDVIEHVNNKPRQEFDTFMNYVKYTTGPNSLGLTMWKNMHLKNDIQILDAAVYNPLIKSFYHEGNRAGVKCVHLLSGWWGKQDIVKKERARMNYEGWRGVRIEDIGK